ALIIGEFTSSRKLNVFFASGESASTASSPNPKWIRSEGNKREKYKIDVDSHRQSTTKMKRSIEFNCWDNFHKIRVLRDGSFSGLVGDCGWDPRRMFFSLRSCEGSETGHYVDAIFSSGLWAAYAFYTNQPIVLFGNVFSFSIQTIFVCLSLYLAPNKAQNATTLKYIFHKISVFVVILLLARCLCHGSRCIQILGIVSMLVSLYCYLKTINVMREAPQKGNLRMPALVTLAALLWLTYGLARSDYYIAVTSAFGLAVGVLGIHSNMQDREEEAPPSNTTVIHAHG
ncbi:unnamed protein product, partial [Arabidopsis halleri]